jgi:nucleolar complex protein 2
MFVLTSKPPTQTKKLKTMQKMILAYFHNTIHLIGQLTDNDMLLLAVNESAKIVPYIISSRKGIKSYLKVRIFSRTSVSSS